MFRRALPILLIIMLASCQSTEELSYLEKAAGLAPAEAIEVYESELGSASDEELYYNLAYSYLQEGRWSDAIETADKALEEYPEMVRFDYLKAYAYRESGMMRSYAGQLESILGKNPADVYIRSLLAEYFQKTGNDEDAQREAWTILEYDTANAVAISILSEYSDFFAAIDQTEEDIPQAPWSSRPERYDTMRILEGEGLLSNSGA